MAKSDGWSGWQRICGYPVMPPDEFKGMMLFCKSKKRQRHGASFRLTGFCDSHGDKSVSYRLHDLLDDTHYAVLKCDSSPLDTSDLTEFATDHDYETFLVEAATFFGTMLAMHTPQEEIGFTVPKPGDPRYAPMESGGEERVDEARGKPLPIRPSASMLVESAKGRLPLQPATAGRVRETVQTVYNGLSGALMATGGPVDGSELPPQPVDTMSGVLRTAFMLKALGSLGGRKRAKKGGEGDATD